MGKNQKQKLFFADGCAPTVEERKWAVSQDNPACPFFNYIGNDNAVQRLANSDFVALGRPNHCCSDQYFALVGPSSTGKTTLAKMFANVIEIPFVEMQAKTIKVPEDIIIKISSVLENTVLPTVGGGSDTLELREVYELDGSGGENYYRLPPMIVFIDEVHLLSSGMMQSLLQVTDRKTAVLEISDPKAGSVFTFNFADVCWVIATTEMGLLFHAFLNRFTEIELELYSRDEIAEIVSVNRPRWGPSVWNLVARYNSRVPREALAFADEMNIEAQVHPGKWPEIARRVAQYRNIDEFGMTKKRMGVLLALEDGPISKSNMCAAIGCQEEELIKIIMPPLLFRTTDEPPLVKTTTRGYEITDEGKRQIELRKNPSESEEVATLQFPSA